jgi:hypothetical protein
MEATMKFILVIPLAASLLLGGCATSGTGPSTADIIAQVRQAAVATCGFLPTIDTVAQILAAGNPTVIIAGTVANAICAAVTATPMQARRRGAVATVNGVVIHGRFVR